MMPTRITKLRRRVKLMILECPLRKTEDKTTVMADDRINVILFENRQWKKFEVPGGRLEKGDQAFETALVREVKEETFNSIDVSRILKSDKIRFIELSTKNEIIRVYFIIIIHGLFDGRLYNDNKKRLSKRSELPQDWREMSGYDRFPIEHLINEVDENNTKEYFYCTNSRGQKKPIYPKTQEFLLEAVQRGLIKELLDKECIFKEFEKHVNRSNTFLDGTSTIVVI